MPVITLLTDFGIEDEYVGIMKGVILSVNPTVSIVDISHRIEPQHISAAAYALDAAYPYFPAGTIHVVVVDPGVGTDRTVIALTHRGHTFLAPDNGVLSLLLEKETPDLLVQVVNPRYFLNPVSRTFHGRDVFAPVSAHLSLGVDLSRLGPVMRPEKMVRLPFPEAFISAEGELCGRVVSIDRFGNLITNIKADFLAQRCPASTHARTVIAIGEKRIAGISTSYASVPVGTPLAIIGSRGCLEIAVNRGNARIDLGAGIGDTIVVRRPD